MMKGSTPESASGPLARLAAGGLIYPIGVDAAVDPTAARGGSVVFQLKVGRQRAALRVVTVDLGKDGRGVRLVQRALRRVVPHQVENRPVHLVGASCQLGADASAEVINEPQVAAGVTRRLHRLMVPLQQPLRVGERAILLGVRRGG